MAADSTAIRAGKAFVEIFADDSKLAQGLRKAQKTIAAWGAGLKSIGTKVGAAGLAMVMPFIAAAKTFADTGSNLVDMSQRTGASVEALSALKFAAEQSGASMEDVEKGIRKLSQNLSDAANGGESAQKAFSSLGLSWRGMLKMKPDERFSAMADAVSKIENPSQRAAAAMEVFGKSGASLMPLMNGGAKGVKELTDEAKRLGLVMSTEDAVAAEEFGDKLDKAFAVIKAGVVKIGAAVMPVLIPFLDWFTNAASATAKWIGENRGLIVTAFTVAGAILAAGAALYVIGAALSIASVGIGGLIKLLPVATFGIKLLTTSLGSMASTAMVAVRAALAAVSAGFAGLLPILAALVSPMGLAIIALAGIAGALAYCVDWSRVASGALSDLVSGFWTLKDESLTTLNAIGNAIAKGNIQLAMSVLWAFIKMEWIKGTNWLLSIWADVSGQIVDAWMSAVFAIVNVAFKSWYGLRMLWESVMSAMERAIFSVTSTFIDGWIYAIGFIQGLWVKFKSLFDDSIDVKLELQGIDEATKAKIGANAVRNNVMQQRSKNDQVDAMTALAREQADLEANLKSQKAGGEQSRAAAREQALADAAAELEKARGVWTDATKEANKATGKAADELSKRGTGGFGDELAGAASATDKSSVVGTFNPFGVRGLNSNGNDGPLRIIVGKIEELTKEVKDIRADERKRPKL